MNREVLREEMKWRARREERRKQFTENSMEATFFYFLSIKLKYIYIAYLDNVGNVGNETNKGIKGKTTKASKVKQQTPHGCLRYSMILDVSKDEIFIQKYIPGCVFECNLHRIFS